MHTKPERPPSYPSDCETRREQLLPALRQSKAEALLVTALPNIRYLSGFTGSNGALLVTSGRTILFTDPRYEIQAEQESDCQVKITKKPLIAEVGATIKRMKIRAVAIERDRINLAEYRALTAALKGVRVVETSGAVEALRIVKAPPEIATIRASVELNSAALDTALRQFKGSMTEIDLAAEIDYRMRRLGADGPAFDTIVASGTRSALPHAHPTDSAIQIDELLLIDMGATLGGYASDMTRTFAVGKLGPKARRMHRAVLDSQLAAIDAVRPGVSSSAVDRAARNVLRKHGLDTAFVHSTGHGLGLEIHERPRIGRKESTKLVAGMAITIEPGVYVEGVGGVRIEDTVVVTSSGCQVLTPTRKELVVL